MANLEEEFKKYSEYSILSYESLPPVVLKIAKRAFMAGSAQTLSIINKKLSSGSKVEVAEELVELSRQAIGFWEEEVRESERRKK